MKVSNGLTNKNTTTINERIPMNTDTKSPLHQLAEEVELLIHKISPNEWFYESALLYGLDDTVNTLSLPQPHGDIYELLDSPLCYPIMQAYKHIVLLTCGWAAPINGSNGDLPPSQCPDRVRCRLVIVANKESREIVSMVRMQNNPTNVKSDDSAEGRLSLAILQALAHAV
jgi:hypothetical protein